MKTLQLTSKELRALKEILFANPCNSGCAYEEMQNSKKDCDNCEFTKSIHSILDKIK